MTMTRRDAIKTIALSSAVLATVGHAAEGAPATSAYGAYPYSLPPLGFAVDALEPHLDAQTMTIHHTKHHQAYIDNLNKALATKPELAAKPLETLLADLAAVPEDVRTVVRNHGGGHANHTLFWKCLAKDGGAPAGKLEAAIKDGFGSLEALKEKLVAGGKGVFGSGWVWLSLDAQKKLVVETTPNQDSPYSLGHTPLLGLDVWEHAYYLKYQNRRPDYLTAVLNVINWNFVTERHAALAG